MEKRVVEESVYYRLGLRSIEHAREAIDDDVVERYEGFSDAVKNRISLVQFSLLNPDTRKMIEESILADGTLFLPVANSVPALLEPILSGIVEKARGSILALPAKPDAATAVVDGYLSAALCMRNKEPQKLDQWQYVTKTRAGQSYESLTPSSLFSKATVANNRALDGDTAHFMMFMEGKTKVECFRFDFGPSKLDQDPKAAGDPLAIETGFLKALGLDTKMAGKLSIHARRLEMVQQILFDIRDVIHETHTQALFDHIITLLLSDLDNPQSDLKPHVEDVTAMDDMNVFVEVCKEYLQGQLQIKGGALQVVSGISVALKIKSDLAVSMLSRSREEDKRLSRGQLKKELLLDCAFNIEMKVAHGELKFGGRKPKSQLIAESLARSLELVTRDGERPSVLFSVLCDCCSLYVLVHFPKAQRAFLSRREVEPGRMVAVLAWVFRTAIVGITMDNFQELFAVGDSFADEVRKRKGGGEKDKGSRTSDKQQKIAAVSGKGSDPQQEEAELVLLSFEDDDGDSEGQRRIENLDAFATFRNHFNLGWPLPLKRSVLEALTEPASQAAKHPHYADSTRMQEHKQPGN